MESRGIEVNKPTWGDGPWQSEPDHKEWRDEATGYPCIAHRHPVLGFWCGYVAVPPGHPAHGESYDDVDVFVHGGLTYANECAGAVCHKAAPGEPDDVYWLGFDTGHFMDYSPHTSALQAENSGEHGGEVYRDLGYVEEECRKLASQLHAMR